MIFEWPRIKLSFMMLPRNSQWYFRMNSVWEAHAHYNRVYYWHPHLTIHIIALLTCLEVVQFVVLNISVRFSRFTWNCVYFRQIRLQFKSSNRRRTQLSFDQSSKSIIFLTKIIFEWRKWQNRMSKCCSIYYCLRHSIFLLQKLLYLWLIIVWLNFLIQSIWG